MHVFGHEIETYDQGIKLIIYYYKNCLHDKLKFSSYSIENTNGDHFVEQENFKYKLHADHKSFETHFIIRYYTSLDL